MEHMDTAESLTSAAETPDQANIVESHTDLLLLPYTATTTSKTPGQVALTEKKPKTKSVQVSVRVKSKTKGTTYEHLQSLKIFIIQQHRLVLTQKALVHNATFWMPHLCKGFHL